MYRSDLGLFDSAALKGEWRLRLSTSSSTSSAYVRSSQAACDLELEAQWPGGHGGAS